MKFQKPEIVILVREKRHTAYGPENGYHDTFKSCCWK